MLRHISIEADNPRRVAGVFAEFWQGEAFSFPVASDDAWMAITDHGGGAMIEVLPRGTELRPGEGDGEAIGVMGPQSRFGSGHVATETRLSDKAVFAIGRREGWHMKYGARAGGLITVIEAWVEGCLMVELLTPALQPAYRNTLTVENCRQMLGAGG